MRTITRLAAAAAAGALALGLAACDEQVPADGSTSQQGGGQTSQPAEEPTSSGQGTDQETDEESTDEESTDGSGTASAEGAQDIVPITFTDPEVGLTQTCDQIITDFDAATYTAEYDVSVGQIVLLHCSITTDELGIDSHLYYTLSMEGGDYGSATQLAPSSIEEDLAAADLPNINEGEGTIATEGWVAFEVWDDGGTPVTEGWTVTYERSALENQTTGDVYASYTDTQDLVLE